MRRGWFLETVAALALLAASWRGALAQSERPQPGGKSAAVDRTDPPQAITAAREAAALTFAREHHPELADLLDRLKDQNQPQYEKAVRQLFQTSERLARVRERSSPETYQLELEAWKLESRIQLLAARMTMSDDPTLQRDLKAALLKRVEVRLELLRAERQRIAERLEKLDEQIQQIERQLEQDAENVALRDFERMQKSVQSKKAAAGGTASENVLHKNAPQKGGPQKSPTSKSRQKPAKSLQSLPR